MAIVEGENAAATLNSSHNLFNLAVERLKEIRYLICAN